MHPPGGATALIFVLGSPALQETGWLFVVSPALSMAVVATLVAFAFNRAVGRTYPQYWW